MRIGIDGRMIKWSGIGRYTKNILMNFSKFDEENEYIIFCNKNDKCEIPVAKNYSIHIVDLSVFSLRGQKKLSRIIKNSFLDIFYTPYIIVPIEVPCKKVGTIHDLIPWRMPEVQRSLLARLFYRYIIKRAAKNWSLVLVDSVFTREDVKNFLGIPDEKIKVITAAADKRYKPVKDKKKIEELRHKYGLSQTNILNVGTTRPHKNLPFLVKVFEDLVLDRKILCQLVLAGGEDKWRPRVRRIVKDSGLEGKVVFTGYIEEEELPILYNQATVCVFPSLFEGFGLPALEAMACGCPVICSDNSSLAETAEGAGILLNHSNASAWVDAIDKVLKDKRLQESMRRKGLERAEQYSWEKTAREILHAFKEVGSQN